MKLSNFEELEHKTQTMVSKGNVKTEVIWTRFDLTKINLSELDHDEPIFIEFKDEPLKIHIMALNTINEAKKLRKTINDIAWIANVPDKFKPLAAEIER